MSSSAPMLQIFPHYPAAIVCGSPVGLRFLSIRTPALVGDMPDWRGGGATSPAGLIELHVLLGLFGGEWIVRRVCPREPCMPPGQGKWKLEDCPRPFLRGPTGLPCVKGGHRLFAHWLGSELEQPMAYRTVASPICMVSGGMSRSKRGLGQAKRDPRLLWSPISFFKRKIWISDPDLLSNPWDLTRTTLHLLAEKMSYICDEREQTARMAKVRRATAALCRGPTGRACTANQEGRALANNLNSERAGAQRRIRRQDSLAAVVPMGGSAATGTEIGLAGF